MLKGDVVVTEGLVPTRIFYCCKTCGAWQVGDVVAIGDVMAIRRCGGS